MEDITRKEAIKKLGKYGALTALGSLIVLSCKKSQVGSPEERNGIRCGNNGNW
tara:strand:+ start:1454 stop:1612 length:159 start_codon:yes stop_codon:yes gene_type:complete